MQLFNQVSATLSSLSMDAVRLCAWLLLLVVIFVPLERSFFLHKQKVFRKSFAIDVVYYFISNLVPKLFLVVPLNLAARAAHLLLPLALYDSIAGWPFWARLVAGLIVGELGAYWGHRLSHQFPLLWRYHSIHHDAEEMDWLVHTRVHPVDMFVSRLCALVPMYFLGLAQPMANGMDMAPLLVTIASTIWGFVIHANLNWRLGPLEWFISTPAFHHWHHTNDGPKLVNKNYAPMFPWVDRCFGTFYLPAHAWPQKYGITAARQSNSTPHPPAREASWTQTAASSPSAAAPLRRA